MTTKLSMAMAMLNEAMAKVNPKYSDTVSVVYLQEQAVNVMWLFKGWLQQVGGTEPKHGLNDYQTRRLLQVCKNDLQPLPSLTSWPGPTVWPDAGLYVDDSFNYAAAEKAAQEKNPFALKVHAIKKYYDPYLAANYAGPTDVLGYAVGGGGPPGAKQGYPIQNYQQAILHEYAQSVDDKLLEYLKNQQTGLTGPTFPTGASVVEWSEKQDPKNFSEKLEAAVGWFLLPKKDESPATAPTPPPEPEPPPTIEQPIPFKRKFS